MERLGFYVCVADLEDELIRSLGTDAVERIIAAQRELDSFHTLQKQPAWHGRPTDQQLRRFLGNQSRKIHYALLLVDALDPYPRATAAGRCPQARLTPPGDRAPRLPHSGFLDSVRASSALEGGVCLPGNR